MAQRMNCTHIHTTSTPTWRCKRQTSVCCWCCCHHWSCTRGRSGPPSASTGPCCWCTSVVLWSRQLPPASPASTQQEHTDTECGVLYSYVVIRIRWDQGCPDKWNVWITENHRKLYCRLLMRGCSYPGLHMPLLDFWCSDNWFARINKVRITG